MTSSTNTVKDILKSQQIDHDLILEMHGDIKALLRSQSDHEARIRKLESNGQITKGALVLLVFLSGLLEPLIVWMQGRHK